MKIATLIGDVLSRALAYCSSASMVIMVLLVTADSFLRVAVNGSIVGAYEISQYLFAVILFGSYAYCQREHGHLHVVVLVRKLPKRMRGIVWAFASLFGVGVGVLLTRAIVAQGLYSKDLGSESFLLGIPEPPFVFFGAFAMAVFTLVLFLDGVKAVQAVFDDQLMEEIMSEWT